MAQKHKIAFTLVEVLIVILIIGILAGLIMLSSGSATDTAERTRCVADRRSLRSALYIFRVEKGGTTSADLSATLNEVLKKMFDNGQGTVSGDSEIDGICPSKGIYAVTISDDKYLIACSVHGGDGGSGGTGTGGGGDGGGTGGGTGGDGGSGTGGGSGSGGEGGEDVMIPGTTVVIPVIKQWDSINEFENYIKKSLPYIIPQGDAIKIGNDYYVAIAGFTINNTDNANGGVLINESLYQKVVTDSNTPNWTANNAHYNKFNIYLYNGSYYVSKGTGTWLGNPIANPDNWVKIQNIK